MTYIKFHVSAVGRYVS